MMHGNIQVGTSLINFVDISGHYTVFSANTFSENAVSITQLLIAFLMLISIVTLTLPQVLSPTHVLRMVETEEISYWQMGY